MPIEGFDFGSHRPVHRIETVAFRPETIARRDGPFGFTCSFRAAGEPRCPWLQLEKDILEPLGMSGDELPCHGHGLSHAHLVHAQVE